MIAFLTLLLGLVHGPVDVALSAAPEVARIELFVDGAKLGPASSTVVAEKSTPGLAFVSATSRV